jgi:hypothetical protein
MPSALGAVFLIGHVPHRPEPHRQGFADVLKDGSRSGSGLPSAMRTRQQSVTNHGCRLSLTPRTSETVGPPQSLQIPSAAGFGREPGLEFPHRPRIISHPATHYILGSAESSGCPVGVFCETRWSDVSGNLLSHRLGVRPTTYALDSKDRFLRSRLAAPADFHPWVGRRPTLTPLKVTALLGAPRRVSARKERVPAPQRLRIARGMKATLRPRFRTAHNLMRRALLAIAKASQHPLDELGAIGVQADATD